MDQYCVSNMALPPTTSKHHLNAGPLYAMCGSRNKQTPRGPQLYTNTPTTIDCDLPISINNPIFLTKTATKVHQTNWKCLDKGRSPLVVPVPVPVPVPALVPIMTKEINEINSCTNLSTATAESLPNVDSMPSTSTDNQNHAKMPKKSKKNHRKRNKMPNSKSLRSRQNKNPDSKQQQQQQQTPATVARNICAATVTNNSLSKKALRMSKNKKQEQQQEIAAWNSHDDFEIEMSIDETDEPVAKASNYSKVKLMSPSELSSSSSAANATNSSAWTLNTDDFPAMSIPIAKTSEYPRKCAWEIPIRPTNNCTSFKGRRPRPPSECDSEDSFIVFENDQSMPSSHESTPSLCDQVRNTLGQRWRGCSAQHLPDSGDDFICFEFDETDNPFDRDDDNDTSDDDDDDGEGDDDSDVGEVASHGTNSPDSGFKEKKVRFNLKPEVHVLRVWRFAYQQARKSEWEKLYLDRKRFRDRIELFEANAGSILDPVHRNKIYNERFHVDTKNNAIAVDCAIETELDVEGSSN